MSAAKAVVLMPRIITRDARKETGFLSFIFMRVPPKFIKLRKSNFPFHPLRQNNNPKRHRKMQKKTLFFKGLCNTETGKIF